MSGSGTSSLSLICLPATTALNPHLHHKNQQDMSWYKKTGFYFSLFKTLKHSCPFLSFRFLTGITWGSFKFFTGPTFKEILNIFITNNLLKLLKCFLELLYAYTVCLCVNGGCLEFRGRPNFPVAVYSFCLSGSLSSGLGSTMTFLAKSSFSLDSFFSLPVSRGNSGWVTGPWGYVPLTGRMFNDYKEPHTFTGHVKKKRGESSLNILLQIYFL